MNFWLKRIEVWLLWLFGFMVAWQLRHTFYFAELGGVYFEYGSLHFYVIDGLLLALVGCFLFDRSTVRVWWGPKYLGIALGGWLLWQAVSILWADDKLSAAWHAGQWWLWGAAYIYIINRVQRVADLVWPLTLGLTAQAGLAVFQYGVNSSVGLSWLGESIFAPGQGGVPVIVGDFGIQVRAHGLMPHPNILGGWLVAGLAWLFWLWQKETRYRLGMTAMMILMTLGLLVTFSRAAWAMLLLLLIVATIVAVTFKARRGTGFLVGILSVFGLGGVWQVDKVFGRFDLSKPLEAKSVGDRIGETAEAVSLWLNSFWVGVGGSNYTQVLSMQDNVAQIGWAYLMVHNSYLLTAAELGAVGICLLLVLLGVVGQIVYRQIKRGLSGLAMAWPIVTWFALGLVDHWLISLHPGMVLWFVALALIILENRLTYKSVRD